MSTLTLDRVLTEVEALSPDEQGMLEELLRHRRVEVWRQETADSAKQAVKGLRDGKLKAQPVEDIITRLRKVR